MEVRRDIFEIALLKLGLVGAETFADIALEKDWFSIADGDLSPGGWIAAFVASTFPGIRIERDLGMIALVDLVAIILVADAVDAGGRVTLHHF